MRWNPPAELDIRETPEELIVITTKDSRMQQIVTTVFIMCVSGIFLATAPSRTEQAFAVFLLVLCIVSLLRRTSIEHCRLTVRASQMVYSYAGIHNGSGSFAAIEVKEMITPMGVEQAHRAWRFDMVCWDIHAS